MCWERVMVSAWDGHAFGLFYVVAGSSLGLSNSCSSSICQEIAKLENWEASLVCHVVFAGRCMEDLNSGATIMRLVVQG
jgi:hypothetical protein